MVDMPKPTSRLGYPFDAKDNKPFTDAQPIYEALAAAVGGHFPLGSNGHFHGGIHIDRSEAHIFDIDNGVKCLADGEIVAYRLDKRYPDATPSTGTASEGEAASDQKVALRPYSTGFVLVRHLLQVPALPSPVSEDGGAQTLTVLDYGTPLAARENGPTIGWVPVYARVALLDMQGNWVKVRILPPSVATWTNESVDEPWLRIRSLDNVPNSLPNRWFGGEPLTATVVLPSQPPPAPQPADTPAPGTSTPPPSLVLYSLYMHLADGATYDARPNIPRPKWWPKTLYRAGNKTTNKWTLNGELIQGLMVRTAPVSANGNEIGILVRESEIEVEPIAGNPRWGVVRNIITGSVATRPDGVRITNLPATGYVFLKELDEFRTPEVFDSIEIPTVPIPVNMGDVIGHIGQQVSGCETLIAGQPTSRPTLHLEVFSAQDVPAFLRDSRRYADKLPERHWTLIRLRKGDPVKAEPKDESPSVTSMTSDWTISVTRDTTIQKDDQDQSWVCVKVHTTEGSQVVGWAKDKDRRSTPWHWPGFEVVDAASNDAGTWWEGAAQVFIDFLRGGARPPETPFFKQIRQLVDLNDDGQLREEELDAALKNRAVAKQLGGLITYHTSEWYVPSWASKYGVISEIAMGLGKRAMDNVEGEKNCVLRLRWWSDVASTVGLPANAKVYHFHPIGFAGNLSGCRCTEEWRIDSEFLGRSEGALETVGYVPKNRDGTVIGQSGVTISTGVDLGQQNEEGTRTILNNYIAEHGNTGNVDVVALFKQLSPYFTLKKELAVKKLSEVPLTISNAQARLLADAFEFDFRVKASKMFDKKNKIQMKFLQLPAQAQTVILDFCYQYYINDSNGVVRQIFWGYLYEGKWKELSNWLLSNPDPYRSRREREGKLLKVAIDNGELPDLGNPCL